MRDTLEHPAANVASIKTQIAKNFITTRFYLAWSNPMSGGAPSAWHGTVCLTHITRTKKALQKPARADVSQCGATEIVHDRCDQLDTLIMLA
jgi:hypothetical protein